AIVQVYDYGEVEDFHYIAMEWVEGGSLGDYVENHGPLSLEMAVAVIMRVCEGIERVHAVGVIHRDIKPDNILLTGAGEPKLTDFGIALNASSTSRVTKTGMAVGSAGFTAPEQASGQRDLDGRVDVHALAVTLWALLRGENPPREFLFSVTLNRHPEDVDWMPSALIPIFLKAVETDRDERYGSVAEFRHALATLVGRAHVNAEQPVRLPTSAPPVVVHTTASTASDTDMAPYSRTSPPPRAVDTAHAMTGIPASELRVGIPIHPRTRKAQIAVAVFTVMLIGLAIMIPVLLQRSGLEMPVVEQPVPTTTTVSARDMEPEVARSIPLLPEPTPPAPTLLVVRQVGELEAHRPSRPPETITDIPVQVASTKKVPRPWKGKKPEEKPGGETVVPEVKVLVPEVPKPPASDTVLVGVSTKGDPTKVWIVDGSSRRLLPARVPPGTYKVIAKFGEKDERVAIATLVVKAGGAPKLQCASAFTSCTVR
ncbi:MAG: serine/threonine-protein kinase, partial [Patescibacteria group bacterium]